MLSTFPKVKSLERMAQSEFSSSPVSPEHACHWFPPTEGPDPNTQETAGVLLAIVSLGSSFTWRSTEAPASRPVGVYSNSSSADAIPRDPRTKVCFWGLIIIKKNPLCGIISEKSKPLTKSRDLGRRTQNSSLSCLPGEAGPTWPW